MSYFKNKLERNAQNEISARHDDSLRLVEYMGRDWIVLEDQGDDDILRIYGVNEKQLADLHAQIGRRLRLAPAATMAHLRQLRDTLDEILKRDEAEQLNHAFSYTFGDELSPPEPSAQMNKSKKRPKKNEAADEEV